MISRLRSILTTNFPRASEHEGPKGRLWFAGIAPSTVPMNNEICGHGYTTQSQGRCWRGALGARAKSQAESGALALVSGLGDALSVEDRARTLEIPSVVYHVLPLPDDIETLQKQIRKEATRELYRRMRNANFTVRIATDADMVRTFCNEYHVPYAKAQHGDDSLTQPLENMLRYFEGDGELLCLEHEGEWVAGQFNTVHNNRYVMAWLGIRNGDRKSVHPSTITGLYVKSMERGIERGFPELSFGVSTPFLGSGTGRPKGLWGGTISRDPYLPTTAHLFADARHERVQNHLIHEPTIFCQGDNLFGIRWLEEGTRPLRHVCRDARRFKSIQRWYVLGRPEVFESGRQQIEEHEKIMPIPCDIDAREPQWLGEAIREYRP